MPIVWQTDFALYKCLSQVGLMSRIHELKKTQSDGKPTNQLGSFRGAVFRILRACCSWIFGCATQRPCKPSSVPRFRPPFLQLRRRVAPGESLLIWILVQQNYAVAVFPKVERVSQPANILASMKAWAGSIIPLDLPSSSLLNFNHWTC